MKAETGVVTGETPVADATQADGAVEGALETGVVTRGCVLEAAAAAAAADADDDEGGGGALSGGGGAVGIVFFGAAAADLGAEKLPSG